MKPCSLPHRSSPFPSGLLLAGRAVPEPGEPPPARRAGHGGRHDGRAGQHHTEDLKRGKGRRCDASAPVLGEGTSTTSMGPRRVSWSIALYRSLRGGGGEPTALWTRWSGLNRRHGYQRTAQKHGMSRVEQWQPFSQGRRRWAHHMGVAMRAPPVLRRMLSCSLARCSNRATCCWSLTACALRTVRRRSGRQRQVVGLAGRWWDRPQTAQACDAKQGLHGAQKHTVCCAPRLCTQSCRTPVRHRCPGSLAQGTWHAAAAAYGRLSLSCHSICFFLLAAFHISTHGLH